MGNSENRRPTWLTEPCPSWCTREHREDDHLEDRIHEDDGRVVQGILGDPDPETLRLHPRAAHLVVRLARHADDEVEWVSIRDDEHPRAGLAMSTETARQLRRALALG